MSKKGGKGSFLDDFLNKPFGGLFDFNGDGKEDLAEQWIGFKMFEEATKKEDSFFDDFDSDSEDYSWRQFCEDGFEYDVDPEDYETEEEYEEALEEAKHGWRDTVEDDSEEDVDSEGDDSEEEPEEVSENASLDNYKITIPISICFEMDDPEDYESIKEAALSRERQLEKSFKKEIRQIREEEKQETEQLADKTIYTYCGVKLPFSDRPYSFRTDDGSLKIGDTVVVPVGRENKEMEGIVVAVGQYARIAVPFPIEKTKFVIRKVMTE